LTVSEAAEGRGGPRLQSASQRRLLEPSGDRRGRPVAARLGVPRGGGSRRDGPRGETAPVPRPDAPIPPRARHRGVERGDPTEVVPVRPALRGRTRADRYPIPFAVGST